MDAVLGLSVTPSSVGLVLVQGHDADGAAMDGAGFEIDRSGSSGELRTPEQAAAAVLRTEAIAAGRGNRVHSIGVTWSDEADAEASLLLKSLSDSGFENVVPVRFSEATDALARGIAEVAGYRTTAVCVIEPEQLIAMVVQTDEGAVQTAVNHTVVTEEDLVGWLSAVFTKADWQPEALVLVGSAEDLDGLLPVLEEALSVPVFSPAEARLALARGAALACAQNEEFSLGALAGGHGIAGAEQPSTVRRAIRRLAPVGPAAMLTAGVVTFVVSASAALALHATPERPSPQARAAADQVSQVPAVMPAPTSEPRQPAVPARAAAPLADPVAAPAPVPEAEPAPQGESIAHEALVARTIVPQPPAAVPSPEPEELADVMQGTRERLSSFGDAEPTAGVPEGSDAPQLP